MDTKKHFVLQTSAALFLENGFQRTSIQDIAEGCNMSKATIYKHFQSKEEIGTHVTLYLFERLIGKMKENRKNTNMTQKEILEKNIVLQIENIRNRDYFVDALFFSFSPAQREKYLPTINQAKLGCFLNLVEDIDGAFPSKVKSNSWELGLNLFGLVKEIAFIDQGNKENLESLKIAAFIMDSLEAISKQREGKTPLVTEERIENLMAYFGKGCEGFRPLAKRYHLMQKLSESVELCSPPECRQELYNAINHLEHEYKKLMPKTYILESLYLYLDQHEPLKEIIKELKEVHN